MRYASIRSMDVSNGEGVGNSLFVQGCSFHCKNCFNKETWDYEGGYEFTEEVREKFLSILNKKRLSILGGEPFAEKNREDICSLIFEIKQRYPNIKIWVYTGYLFEELLDIIPESLKYIDFIVDGRYIDELKDYKLKFRGSTNQRIIDVKKTIKKGEICLYDNI